MDKTVGQAKQIMVKYFPLVILLFSISCSNGTAEAEEAHIKSRITRHNVASLPFLLDSINRRTNIRARALLEGATSLRAEEISDSEETIIYKNKDYHYDPTLDHDLTFERFMRFCRDHNLDPIKKVNEMSVK